MKIPPAFPWSDSCKNNDTAAGNGNSRLGTDEKNSTYHETSTRFARIERGKKAGWKHRIELLPRRTILVDVEELLNERSEALREVKEELGIIT